MIFLATLPFGAGISPDSVNYIAAARHLLGGDGFLRADNTPFLLQPPLYPSVLAIIGFVFDLDPLLVVGSLNAILFGATLYLLGLLIFKHFFFSPFFALLGIIVISVSIALVEVFLWAWSEPLFIFLVVLYLYSISMDMENKNNRSLLLLSVSTALACTTRYIGMVLFFTSTIYLLLNWGDGLKITRKIKQFLIFIFLSALPIGIWAARNYVLSGTLLGSRGSSFFSLSDNLAFTFKTLLHWYLPEEFIQGNMYLLLLICGLVLLSAVIVLLKKTSQMKILMQKGLFFVFIFILVLSYVILLEISSTTTAFSQTNNRLLSPMAIPINLLVFSGVEYIASKINARFSKTISTAFIVICFVLLIIHPLRITLANLNTQSQTGQGYSSREWKTSNALQFIKQNDLSTCTIYSNGADVIYFYTNAVVNSIPIKKIGADVIADLSTLKQSFPQEESICIIWFDQIYRNYLFTPEELLSVTSLNKTTRLDDGVIYFASRISKDRSQDEN